MAELLIDHTPSTDVTRPIDDSGLDRIGVALADPTRRAILIRLVDTTWRPSELADSIGISRPKLSNHLACLRGCGLIEAHRSGRNLHYTLVTPEFGSALRTLLDVAARLPECSEPT